MKNHRRKVLLTMMLIITLAVFGQQSSNDHKKFLGVWNCSKTNGIYGNIKITESDGELYVQVKTELDGIKKAKAYVNNGVLQWTFVNRINYGKWKIGAQWHDGYRPDMIVVYHNDGSYGSNGDHTGKYPQYYQGCTANKEIEYVSFKGEIKNGDMQIYFLFGSDYCSDNIPLFYQSSLWVLYDTYTNW
ncbi:MAG TPA: hypothetical protein OIM43_07105 [Prevotellaceae bacterium]|jgi:hypothetical protein|nr:hypothetical protein [Prevotellaceae bacterium]